ncbi:MAG: endopeptidase La [Paramuribaculum sp.]|nr:endopeptidase La [Paramuribaculum sp.]
MDFDSPKILSVEKIDIANNGSEKEPDYERLPVLPTRDLVLFPGATIPISLKRVASILTASYSEENGIPLAVICQTDHAKDYPSSKTDLQKFGVVADIMKILTLPDSSKMAIVKARGKIKIQDVFPSAIIEGGLACKAVPVRERSSRVSDKEMMVLSEWIRQRAKNILSKSTDGQPDMMLNLDSVNNTTDLINIIATLLPISPDSKAELLSKNSIKERGFCLLTQLAKQEQLLDINREISEKTHQNLSQQQRNAFLHQQMETIRQELFGDDDPESDLKKLKEKAAALPLPEDVKNVFERECAKLGRLAPQSPDYSVLFSYLQLLTDLPWGKEDKLNENITEAAEILNGDHFGLEKVKERILEQIALLINSPEGRSPIICLVGAPGVGKTSLGQSIANALGRKYVRVALGGLHDESEIRGHRRTYIGAMPGRIIDALRRARTKNPVLLLDEIDKLSNDFHGDPSAALLEVLDPEQNHRFHDNYVDVDFDLSKVLFIATANSLTNVASPLVDRMEVIDISGYLLEEKVEIAKRHLLPKLLKEANLTSDDLSVSDSGHIRLIETYTSESGVRQLEKRLASIVRKIVLKKVSGKKWKNPLTEDDLFDLLGAAPYFRDKYADTEYAGVVTGLAWTAAGGCILTVEASISPGKGEKLTLTGNLGDVMKESATIALQHIKTRGDFLGIDKTKFEDYTLHIHVPEGAIPKDGPSAGITMATAIASVFTGRKVKPRIAMTGELTLRGKVLPIGGVKEKILAAKRAGITDVLLPSANKKDVDDILPKYIEDLNIIYVDDIRDILNYSLES